MKKLILISTLFLFISCSDGDLQIETLDFDSVVAQNCGTLSTNTTLFFKIDGNEALILTLQSDILKNEATTEDIISVIPSESKLVYRTFSDNISKNYFCDTLPPIAPTVTEEIEAANGSVIIKTVAGENDTFIHTISLSNITLLKGDGTRITDLTISNFTKDKELTTTK